MRLGLCGVLFIVFLTLKLAGVIAWSWLWVTAPLWIGFIVGAAIIVILVLIGAISEELRRSK